jgi:glycosyltransferase involved in cell wall biosynthesis
MKRIAVIALSVSPDHSGNKTYIVNLLRELFEVSKQEYLYYILCNKENVCIFEGINSKYTNFVIFPTIFSNRFLRVFLEQTYLPFWLGRNKIDLLFAARNVMPLMSPCPAVIAVHSMHLNYEKLDKPWYQQIYGKNILRSSAHRADAILAVSEYAGRTYADAYQIPEDRLFVSYEGVKEFDSADIKSSVPQDNGYLLFVSTLFPHKNLHFLVRVFSLVSKSIPESKLVVVGKDINNTVSRLKDQARRLGIQDRIEFMGRISDSELSNLYQNAVMFVFPSLVEGFGLPVLEAMAHSVPVVASNRTSLPEVVGDAGIILDPDNEASWVNSIIQLYRDKELHHQLAIKSKQRAAQFTWRNAAQRTFDCFQSVLENTNKR